MIGVSGGIVDGVNADQELLWMSQWQSASVELEKVRTRELREMTEEAPAELSNRCAIPAADFLEQRTGVSRLSGNYHSCKIILRNFAKS